MPRIHLWILAALGLLAACQPTAESPTVSQTSDASTAIAASANALPTIISPNAYKVPYLGLDGTFHLNLDSQNSIQDVRNPRRLDIKNMEEITFYNDTTGKKPIARDCHYVYLGAVPDAKYYQMNKTAVWELFELAKDDSKDPACSQFTYVVLTAPHDDPVHLHLRYGSDQSSFPALMAMSNAPEDPAQFNPWFAAYCGSGKMNCGTGE